MILDALEDLASNVPWIPIIIIIVVAYLAFPQSRFGGFPIVNGRRPWETTDAGAKRRFRFDGSCLLRNGFKKSSIFSIITDMGHKLVVSGKYTEDLRDESGLSHYKGIGSDFVADVPGFESFSLGSLHDSILRDVISVVTRELGQFTQPLSVELDRLLQRYWSNTTDWHEISLNETMLQMITRTSSLVFVGEPMCRDPKWLEITTNYIMRRHEATSALHMWPKRSRWVVHWFLPSARKLRAEIHRAREIIMPLLEARKREKAATVDAGPVYQKKKELFSSLIWVDDYAGSKNLEYDPALVQLRLANTAIHTSADLVVKVLMNLCENQQVLQDVRKEIISVVTEHGWDTGSLHKLRLMDSVMKESQRLHPLTAAPWSRFTERAITLSDGTQLPSGVPILITDDLMRDPELYPNPDKFDGYRFLRMREITAQANSAPFVNPSSCHVAFGFGKYACPGRFFVANEVKIALCHILLKYDLRIAGGGEGKGESPKIFSTGFITYRDPCTLIEVKRRDEELKI
ncbi:cytochrome P450 monooxygenase [Penicillium sp. CMV-2018d]|nr:cytochrome P450 monooxygenase [Penicillium sp. CMV-2018d]